MAAATLFLTGLQTWIRVTFLVTKEQSFSYIIPQGFGVKS